MCIFLPQTVKIWTRENYRVYGMILWFCGAPFGAEPAWSKQLSLRFGV